MNAPLTNDMLAPQVVCLDDFLAVCLSRCMGSYTKLGARNHSANRILDPWIDGTEYVCQNGKARLFMIFVRELTSAHPLQVVGTLTIAIGVIFYEANDINFSPQGVLLVAVNLSAAVLERIAQRHLLVVTRVDVSKPSLMILNNLIGCCLVMVIIVIFSPSQVNLIWDAATTSRDTAFWVAISCIVGTSLSYFGIWLQVRFVA